PGRAGGTGGGGGEGGGRGGGAPGAGAQQDVFNRPTDVAWDAQGNIFVADGRGNARVAKFSKDGVFVKSWGQRGNGPGQFAIVGKFGRAGKLLKEFGTVNAIDCRTENVLYVGEVGNLRVQKLTLR